LEKDASESLPVLGKRLAPRVFDRHTKCMRVAHGCIPADPLRQFDSVLGLASLKQLLQALMHEPESRLKVQDGLADHRKAEVPRFDHPGMNRADRDLIHPVSLDRAKRIRAVDVAEL